jgi:hypothetical protein
MEQSPAEGVAFVTVRLSDGRLGHQPKVTRSSSSELQSTVEELRSTVARQQATITQLKQNSQSRLAHQQQIVNPRAALQKVSAVLEASKRAPQMVVNSQ